MNTKFNKNMETLLAKQPENPTKEDEAKLLEGILKLEVDPVTPSKVIAAYAVGEDGVKRDLRDMDHLYLLNAETGPRGNASDSLLSKPFGDTLVSSATSIFEAIIETPNGNITMLDVLLSAALAPAECVESPWITALRKLNQKQISRNKREGRYMTTWWPGNWGKEFEVHRKQGPKSRLIWARCYARGAA